MALTRHVPGQATEKISQARGRGKGRPGQAPVVVLPGQKISGMKVWSDSGGRT
jgi:hypothetical protein